MYLIHYGWYYMPSTVHKILVHGCDVIEFFNLPIGCLSEEALEASHKVIRKVRYSHTRKTSREHTNNDLMTHLLLCSDPMLSSKRTIKVKSNLISKDIKKYILVPDVMFSTRMVEESSCSDSEIFEDK